MDDDDLTTARPLGWLEDPRYHEWLRSEELRLLRFPAVPPVSPDGAALVLGRDGYPIAGREGATFEAGRMAHVHGVAALRGEPGTRPVITRLVARLVEVGPSGWSDRLGTVEDRELYTLDFVVLAAATGTVVGVPGAAALLTTALDDLDASFTEAGTPLGIDRVAPDGTPTEYRGMNANMHLVEALFAASDALRTASGDAAAARAAALRARAFGIVRFVLERAATTSWRVAEHHDASWNPMPDHNRDVPDDAFRPYGSTVGHGMEWSRLVAQAAADGDAVDATLLDGAIRLYRRARTDGWSSDGAPGVLYTVDWDGTPVSRRRLHWVLAEAIAASAVLTALTGAAEFALDHERWVDHLTTTFRDREHGSWHHELDLDGEPVGEDSKPDLYHAYQSVLLPQLPVRASVAAAVLAARARPAAVRVP